MPQEEAPHYYPITIVKTRYGGTYEGGNFAAFNMYAEQIPEAASGDDITTMDWWGHFGRGVGLGSTPQEAYENLLALNNVLQMVWDADKRVHFPEIQPWKTHKRYVP